MMNVTSFPVLLIYCFIMVALIEAYDPSVKVDKCSPDSILLTVSGADHAGIVYIKGHGAACQQETNNVTSVYEFVFDECGVNPYELFQLIVQKNPFYQTREDLQIPVWCIYEMSISVDNTMGVLEPEDLKGINKTFRPSASMFLFKDGQDITGSDVKLGDVLTMTIQLANEFTDDFDLRAKYCTANSIPLIENFCAPDVNLFPNLQHPVQGALTASFSAFRSTNFNDGAVNMVFSCTLQLCKGLCSVDKCQNQQDAYGRRKRSAIPKNDVAFDDVSVGVMMRIAADEETNVQSPDTTDEYCVSMIVLILIVTIISIIILSSFGTMVVLLKRDPVSKKDFIFDVIQAHQNKDTNNCSLQLTFRETTNL